MSVKNKKFIEILKSYDIEISSQISEGRLDKIHINKEQMEVTIVIKLPAPVDIKFVILLRDKLIEQFRNVGYKKVEVQYLYDNPVINKDLLTTYFEYTVNHFEAQKLRYAAFRSFNRDIEDDLIKIYVATEDEVAVVRTQADELNDIFRGFGLNTNIEVIVSGFETPIKEIIEENSRRIEEEVLREQQFFDSIKDNDDKKKPRYKQPTKMKSGLNRELTPLPDVPATETEIVEHRQKYGNLEFTVLGEIVDAKIDEKNKRDGSGKFRIFEGTIFDGKDSIMIKTFISDYGNDYDFYQGLKIGENVRVYGLIEYDKFARDVVLKINEIRSEGVNVRSEVLDNAPVKRVELHAHTKMSVQDSVMDVNDYVAQAVKFKHKALAVTDFHNIHVFPDFYNATKNLDIKPIFGVEGELIDEASFKIALTDGDASLKDATYVVYDIETTGLSSNYNEIIEIAGVKVRNGAIIDEFSTFVKPTKAIKPFITELTSITNDDVRIADPIDIVLPKFKAFIGDAILVAHNATFDNSHLYANMKRLGIFAGEYKSIDTLQLSRARYGHSLKTFNLKAVAKYFDVELEQHHRAIYDTKTTAYIFIKMLNELLDAGITNYNQINTLIDNEELYKLAIPTHFTILVRDLVGKKNLYEIISDSHTKHYHRGPRILKNYLQAHRQGLLIGSGCINGDVFEVAYNRSYEELLAAMQFYDYIEVQPPSICEVLVEKHEDTDIREYIKDTIKTILKAAKELGKIVVATGDVHQLTKEETRLREIYTTAPKIGGGTHDLADIKNLPATHFMTTDEMMAEFSFLDTDVAYEIVVTNTNKIASMIDRFSLFPDELFAPSDNSLSDKGVTSFKEGVNQLTYENAHQRYGNELPEYIKHRLEKELNSIIGNNFASVYYISHMLVESSKKAGYIVGSRGSVGSSLVATLMGITEVNPLPPHYVCPQCHFTAIKYTEDEKKRYPRTESEKSLDEKLQAVQIGYDLEEMDCPECGHGLERDGFDIPFETFLGFNGEKVPDIDLNFSGEYQSRAHEYCRELFGEDHTFRAGTISTIAEKTAYGYVRKYFEKKGVPVRNAEVNRIIKKIQGAKRSTGQHPGGIIVVPKEIEFSDIIPVQYPADDITSSWRTTHFDYHKFEDNLLKLDILGHDDPTMIRHLMDFVHKYPEEFPFSKIEDIPLADKKVLGLFNGLEPLKLSSIDLNGETIGTTGIPEFGTPLTKTLLSEVEPSSIADLIKISGLSHGTNVWRGNSRDFFLGLHPDFPETVPFSELIGCRDDIMVYLISKGLPASDAFKIMESVRKGKGVSKDYEKEMNAYNVPKWYIESCKLIEYMFPKAHAAAYVIMALRIAWFKVYRPIFYYAAYFSRRTDAFDVATMAKGREALKLRVKQLADMRDANSWTKKDEDTYNTLLLSLEMVSRGFAFDQINIFESSDTNFLVSKDRKRLLIPFNALDSLGDATANSIVVAREERPFTSKRDVMKRTKINTTLFERMDSLGCFGNLPEDDQIGLF